MPKPSPPRYCAYCGKRSDRGMIYMCRACTETKKREQNARENKRDEPKKKKSC